MDTHVENYWWTIDDKHPIEGVTLSFSNKKDYETFLKLDVHVVPQIKPKTR